MGRKEGREGREESEKRDGDQEDHRIREKGARKERRERKDETSWHKMRWYGTFVAGMGKSSKQFQDRAFFKTHTQ